MLTGTDADVAQLTRAWEVFAVLVERDGHHPICCVKGFLDAVAMVYIDVDVEHALLEPEQLDDCQYDVCHNTGLLASPVHLYPALPDMLD
jgi:hypothetical protein